MAFVFTAQNRSYSIGPVMQQRGTYTAASGDTSGTLVFTSLSNVSSVIIPGVQLLTQTITGNSVAITFTDPVASIIGCAEAHGT
jgi:hypothetical protein